jgi:hypothetical protein
MTSNKRRTAIAVDRISFCYNTEASGNKQSFLPDYDVIIFIFLLCYKPQVANSEQDI